MQKVSAIAILNASMFVWWGALLVNVVIEPSIAIEGDVISLYGTFSETIWIFSLGNIVSGLLTILLSRRISSTYLALARTMFIVGVCSIFISFFPLEAGNFNFAVHGILSLTASVSILVGLTSATLKLEWQTNMLFVVIAFSGQLILILGSTFVKVINQEFIGQILLLGSYGLWLQINLRRYKSLTGAATAHDT